MSTAFHLNNKETICELAVHSNYNLLPFCPVPTYIEVKLDRLLTFGHHIEALCKKIILLVTRLKRFAGSEWGADAKILQIKQSYPLYTPQLSTVHWCGVAVLTLNSLMVFSITPCALFLGCLRPTPTNCFTNSSRYSAS